MLTSVLRRRKNSGHAWQIFMESLTRAAVGNVGAMMQWYFIDIDDHGLSFIAVVQGEDHEQTEMKCT
jgi:hypothetical protein